MSECCLIRRWSCWIISPRHLQVGDQVPVSTGTATVLTSNNTVVSTISYMNTGVILNVTPRISASGNVVLDVQQETSSVNQAAATGSPDTHDLDPQREELDLGTQRPNSVAGRADQR